MTRPAGDLPLVSAIIPTYNGASYMAETIESVLAQDYTRIETIVADDGSTDDTLEILHRYGDRIRNLMLPHRGENAARNAAIGASTGDYIAFLDHDDLWLPDKISRQVAALQENPRAGLCHTGYQRFDAGGCGARGAVGWTGTPRLHLRTAVLGLLCWSRPACTVRAGDRSDDVRRDTVRLFPQDRSGGRSLVPSAAVS